jgi:hypothetical protein
VPLRAQQFSPWYVFLIVTFKFCVEAGHIQIEGVSLIILEQRVFLLILHCSILVVFIVFLKSLLSLDGGGLIYIIKGFKEKKHFNFFYNFRNFESWHIVIKNKLTIVSLFI